MKVLLIGKEVKNTLEITNFSTMWMHYLPQSLKNNGVEISYFPRLNNNQDPLEWARELLIAAEGYDAILAPGVRYFTTIPLDVCKWLRSAFKGIISQVYDASMLDNPHVDLTLTIIDSTEKYLDNPDRMRRHLANNSYIGWAADHNIFTPKQGEKLRIFVDHSTFDCSKPDLTLIAMMNLIKIKIPFEARTLDNDGLQDIDVNNIIVRPFNRNSVSAEEFSNELNRAHIFICTHPESLGQTIIEAAMAGCFILTPPNAIPKDRIQHVNHSIYNGTIDWELAIKMAVPEENRKRALEHTWDHVAKRAIASFISYEKNTISN